MADKIEILITANDKASEELKNVAGKIEGSVSKQTGLLNSFKSSWVELSSMVNVASQAFQTLKGVYDDVIGGTVEYAGEVRNLSRLIGATPEEASKLIQAADDVNISYDTLSTALQVAIRKGISPTIDGIGKLADSYLKIQDPIERSKFLMDNFGRSGAALGPLMERGAAGIKAMGDSAEELGLVLDREAIRKTREYEIAMDDLGDQINGIKTEIGIGLIPKITELIKFYGKLGEIHSFADLAREYKESFMNIWFDARDKMVNMYETGVSKSEDLMGATNNLGIAMDDLGKSVDGTTGELEDMNAEQERVKGMMNELSIFIRGDLGKTTEEYKQKVDDLTKEYEKNKQKILELNQQKTLTDEQKQELETTIQKQDEIQQKIKDVKDEWDKQTKSVLFNLLQQQLAVDGLTTAEAEALGDVAKNWGLIDQPTYQAWQRIQDYIGSLQGAKIDAQGLWDAVNGIPNEKKVNITATINGWTLEDLEAAGILPQYYNPNMYAEGADFIVPPGFPNDTFPINVSSGERVIVIPKEDVGKTGGGFVETSGGNGAKGGAMFVVNYAPMISTVDRWELETRLKPIIEKVIRNG